jgi:hypothetical protein
VPDGPDREPPENSSRRRRELRLWNIDATLDPSAKTVSNYVSNVLSKVHATDRAKLTLMALEAGMGQGPAQLGGGEIAE